MATSYSFQLKLYPALTEDRIEQLNRIGLTEAQMKKIQEEEKKKLDEKEKNMTLLVRGQHTHQGKPLKLLLLGHTGVGKSATANLITGKTDFRESHGTESCTKTVTTAECEVDGIKVTVMDTPGFNDTSVLNEAIMTELAKVVEFYRHGIDGVLFLYNGANPRFTKEQKAVFDQIHKGILGREFINKCFVIITYGHGLISKQSLSDYVKEESKHPASDFGKVLTEIVKRRVILVDNSEASVYGRQLQREQVVRLVAADTSEPCTPAIFGEFLRHHLEQLKGVPPRLHHLAEEIEGIIYGKLEGLTRDEILNLTEEEKQQVIRQITNYIHANKHPYGGNITELLDAVDHLYGGVQQRLTSRTFMERLKGFWQYLLEAIGLRHSE